MNKHQRYRSRCRREGRCPHCGKPALPYAECADRRFYKRMNAALRRMVAWGMVRQVEGGGYVIADPAHRNPRGRFYRVDPAGQAPRGFRLFAEDFLRDRCPASGDEIAAAFTEYRRRLGEA